MHKHPRFIEVEGEEDFYANNTALKDFPREKVSKPFYEAIQQVKTKRLFTSNNMKGFNTFFAPWAIGLLAVVGASAASAVLKEPSRRLRESPHFLRPRQFAATEASTPRGEAIESRRLSSTSWIPVGGPRKGKENGENFGYDVALSATGTIMIASAPFADIGGANIGHVRIYQFLKPSGVWSLAGEIRGERPLDESGTSVDVSSDGTRIVIGAPNNDGNGAESGHARVFFYNLTTTSWDQLGQDLDGEASGVRAGTSVAMNSDGTIVAVAQPYSSLVFPNGTSIQNTGSVAVYKYSTRHSNWTQLGPTIRGTTQDMLSGFSCDINAEGNVLAVGGPHYAHSGVTGLGQVSVYRYSHIENDWLLMGSPITGAQDWEELGYSLKLALDGRIVAIGRPTLHAFGPRSGAVHVYRYQGTSNTWNPVGDLIVGASQDDLFGASLSLSADGTRLVAKGNKGTRQFSFINGTWTQVGGFIGAAMPDRVALSADGKTIASGDVKSGSVGSVSVFQYPDQIYDIHLINVHSSFSDQLDLPEVELDYAVTILANNGVGYFNMTILDHESCTIKDTSGAIKPRLDANGTIGTYAVSDLTVKIDVDKRLITQTPYYTASADFMSGVLRFCAKMEYFDPSSQALATAKNKIKLELNQLAKFEMVNMDGSRLPSALETVHYVDFDYATTTYICDRTNRPITPAPRRPGQSLRFCVRTPVHSEVEVKSVRNVFFLNTMVPLLTIKVIDEAGRAIAPQVSITCLEGICNIKTVTFGDLYEYDVGNNGTLVDVSNGVFVEGQAVLSFAESRRRRLATEGDWHDMETFPGDGITLDDSLMKAVIAAEGEEATTGFQLKANLAAPRSACSVSSLSCVFITGICSAVLMMMN
ncbi:Inherit from COG: Hemolysin-type calcium-binding [Seminavis robusta]|uniref:Inherit from COG: Hemolysin-type calcium-binding n=1 Tax=Seminavis robusta TaxID=568900 RepID=A0A9N8H9D9_9STRA|nr:Inherit from COG: Hemolysin-type calcium-binding [Seminavis robusta]|eukprot:Sro272_g104760.1 Inherit from COG: Hemolysin-type calcium-binding (872) ;mRNA; f:6676-9481